MPVSPLRRTATLLLLVAASLAPSDAARALGASRRQRLDGRPGDQPGHHHRRRAPHHLLLRRRHDHPPGLDRPHRQRPAARRPGGRHAGGGDPGRAARAPDRHRRTARRARTRPRRLPLGYHERDPFQNLPAFDRAARRKAVLDEIGAASRVFRAPAARVHANDVEYRYRPDTDLYYLTGFDEADAVLVLDRQRRARARRAVRPAARPGARDLDRQARRRRGRGRSVFGADAAYPMEELARAPDADHRRRRRALLSPRRRRAVQPAHARDRAHPPGRSVHAPRNDLPTSLHDTGPLVHELRLRKSPARSTCMQRAIAITGEAHRAAMREVRPGHVRVRDRGAASSTSSARSGASGPAYPSIVAGGDNATVLHYIANDRPLRDGELLLIDAGAEFGCYCADVTRTFPVGRDFTPAQRARLRAGAGRAAGRDRRRAPRRDLRRRPRRARSTSSSTGWSASACSPAPRDAA